MSLLPRKPRAQTVASEEPAPVPPPAPCGLLAETRAALEQAEQAQAETTERQRAIAERLRALDAPAALDTADLDVALAAEAERAAQRSAVQRLTEQLASEVHERRVVADHARRALARYEGWRQLHT